MRTLLDVTAPKVEQLGPRSDEEFVYVDISSIDTERKRIVEPKRLPSNEAPSRAKQRLKKGDVLVSMTRPNRNAVAIVPAELDGAIGSTGFHVLRARDGVDPRWIFNAVQTKSFIASMEDLVQGALYPAVRPKDIQSYSIPVPPLDEQRIAVAEIEKQFSRLDEAVANLKRVKANLKRYKAAVLKAAVEGHLVPTEAELSKGNGRVFETGTELLQRVLENRRRHWSGRGKYIEPLCVEALEPFAIPEGWTWASTDQLSDFVTKGTTPAATKLFDGKGAVQFLKVYNLTFDGSLNAKHKPAFIARETHEVELARSKVRAGDVLINIVGPPLGQVAMVPETLAEANINQAIARIRPIEPLDQKFIAIMLMCREIMQWAIRRAKTTAGQSNLTLELCRALPLPLPPLTEQHRIVTEVERRFSLIRGVEAQTDANLKRAERMRQAILARMFGAPVGVVAEEEAA